MTFKPTPAHSMAMKKEFSKNRCYVNSQGIIVSRERPQNEVKANEYNNYWIKNPRYSKDHFYTQIAIDLCHKWYDAPQDVLEIGAGFGHAAEKFIKEFKLESYTGYEFSECFNELRDRIKSTGFFNYKIYNYDFQQESIFSGYDCVIALEILEHINKDLEFLEKLDHGTWVFFSVPSTYSRFHVRFFPFPISVHFRFQSLLNIYEIKGIKNNQNIYKWWVVAARKR